MGDGNTCGGCGTSGEQSSRITSLDAALLTHLTSRAMAGAETHVHVVPDGGIIVSHASKLSNGLGGTVHFEGSIGPIPYKGDITVEVDLGRREIHVKLHLDLPFPFDHEWIYKMQGVVDLGNGGVSVSSLVLDTSRMAPAAVHPSLNWLCVLKCGGLAILGILVKCLPSLSGGVPGYVACVTSQAGQGAASIAVCIAQKCT